MYTQKFFFLIYENLCQNIEIFEIGSESKYDFFTLKIWIKIYVYMYTGVYM